MKDEVAAEKGSKPKNISQLLRFLLSVKIHVTVVFQYILNDHYFVCSISLVILLGRGYIWKLSVLLVFSQRS